MTKSVIFELIIYLTGRFQYQSTHNERQRERCISSWWLDGFRPNSWPIFAKIGYFIQKSRTIW